MKVINMTDKQSDWTMSNQACTIKYLSHCQHSPYYVNIKCRIICNLSGTSWQAATENMPFRLINVAWARCQAVTNDHRSCKFTCMLVSTRPTVLLRSLRCCHWCHSMLKLMVYSLIYYNYCLTLTAIVMAWVWLSVESVHCLPEGKWLEL